MEFRNNSHQGNIREEYNRIIDHYINLLTTVNTLQNQLTTTQSQINRRIQNVTTTLRWLPNDNQHRPSSLNDFTNIFPTDTLPLNTSTNINTPNISSTLRSTRQTGQHERINSPEINVRGVRNTRSSRRRQPTNNSRYRDVSIRDSNTQTTNRQSNNPPNRTNRNNNDAFTTSNSESVNNAFRNMIVEIQNINTDTPSEQNPVSDLITALLSSEITRSDASMNILSDRNNEQVNLSQNENTRNIPSPFPQFTPFQSTEQQNVTQPVVNTTNRPQTRNNGVSTNIFTTTQPFTTTLMTPTFGGGLFGGTSLFENVPVFPSPEQIDNATRTVAFQEIESPINTSCPITMENFESTQLVMQITHCGHIFNPTHLHSWFRTHVKCPVCRHDIRESQENQQTSLNDTSNNTVTRDIFSSTPLVDIEQPLSSLGTRNTLPTQTSSNQHTPYRPGRLSLLSLANAASRSPPVLTSQLSPISSNSDIANSAVSNSTNSLVEDNSGNEIQLPTYTFNPPITTFNTTTAQNGVSLVSQGRIIHTDNRLGELTALTSITENILRSMITEIDISGNPLQNQINTETNVNNSNQSLDVSNNSQQTTTTDVSGGTVVNGNFLSQDILDSLGYMSQD
uniref:RING-type domain-containing protein n=1 Tax=viral metagenome TaxID=1070528 RepID=A0A6C0FDB4_9ZZZZ|tara:strand:+ start:22268 stop:24133 length:1866 start_codon:yes stop_codon:yes gene_type:complete